MTIQFWGVRGSLPSPQLSSQVRGKIAAVLERAAPEDLQSPESRARFLAGLPPWLYGAVGGNTPCVSLLGTDPESRLVFDCGSGLRELGVAMASERPAPKRYHIFLSHLHWDHIQGLPFFGPAYDPSVSLDFYSPMKSLAAALRAQMRPPYFPVRLRSTGSRKNFHAMEGEVAVGGMAVSCRKLSHPGGSYAYAVADGARRFVYATDCELSPEDFAETEENAAFFQDADLAAIDAQYTTGDAIKKYDWGHSAFGKGVDFAARWGIKRLALFHHDPAYDDRKLFGMLQSARWYAERMGVRRLEIILAQEGMEISL